MADLTITPASVIAGSNSRKEAGTAGATITAGMVVYKGPTGRFVLADADSATAAARAPYGIALNGASDGQPLTVHRSGDITIGATLTAGAEYVLSDEPGVIGVRADLATGDYIVVIGLAKSTTVLAVNFQVTGVVL